MLRTTSHTIYKTLFQLVWQMLNTNFYYSENALSAITSSSKHGQPRAAIQAGLAYRVMGLVCERSVDWIPGEPPIIAPPMLLEMWFSLFLFILFRCLHFNVEPLCLLSFLCKNLLWMNKQMHKQISFCQTTNGHFFLRPFIFFQMRQQVMCPACIIEDRRLSDGVKFHSEVNLHSQSAIYWIK